MQNSTQPEFERDEAKSKSTLEKHGIDFYDVVRIFDRRPAVHAPSNRPGEERWIAISQLSGLMISVVYTVRDDKIRIVTARRARKNERIENHENHSGGCDPPEK